MKEITRRELLLSLPAFAMAPRLFAQGDKPAIPVRALNQITLLVSDVKRSVDFYQGLFGMPIQARQGSTVVLRIGNGGESAKLQPYRHERREFQPGPSHRGARTTRRHEGCAGGSRHERRPDEGPREDAWS